MKPNRSGTNLFLRRWTHLKQNRLKNIVHPSLHRSSRSLKPINHSQEFGPWTKIFLQPVHLAVVAVSACVGTPPNGARRPEPRAPFGSESGILRLCTQVSLRVTHGADNCKQTHGFENERFAPLTLFFRASGYQWLYFRVLYGPGSRQ